MTGTANPINVAWKVELLEMAIFARSEPPKRMSGMRRIADVEVLAIDLHFQGYAKLWISVPRHLARP